jgi:hypothetical protein
VSSGSWSIGDFGVGAFAASKQWSGGDGKYETWPGGIRAKWNNYTMLHHKLTQDTSAAPFFPDGNVPLGDISVYKGYVGWSDNDELRLLNKLAERVKGHSFDLGINIAEGAKTYGTILSNLRSIGKSLLYLKHGNVPAALRTLGATAYNPHNRDKGLITFKRLYAKDLSGRWLETQYAFLPLVSQSYEAAKALKALTGARRYRFTVDSGTKRAVSNISPTPSYVDRASFTYSKRLLAELSEDISFNRSLGLTNPAAIAWEVVPWSFVIDWFLPIGSYLSAWGVIPALKGRFLSVERGAVKGGVIQNHVPGWLPGTHYEKSNRKEEAFRITRTVSSSLSCPMPTFNRIPRALSPKRLLNAVALIHQRLR